MWEEKISTELLCTAVSVILGFVLGLLYSLLSGIFKYKKSSCLTVAVMQFLFSAFSAFVFFFTVLLFNNGIVRMYFILFFAVSFFAFYKILSPFLLKTVIIFEKTLKILIKPLATFYLFVYNLLVKVFSFAASKIKKKGPKRA